MSRRMNHHDVGTSIRLPPWTTPAAYGASFICWCGELFALTEEAPANKNHRGTQRNLFATLASSKLIEIRFVDVYDFGGFRGNNC